MFCGRNPWATDLGKLGGLPTAFRVGPGKLGVLLTVFCLERGNSTLVLGGDTFDPSSFLSAGGSVFGQRGTAKCKTTSVVERSWIGHLGGRRPSRFGWFNSGSGGQVVIGRFSSSGPSKKTTSGRMASRSLCVSDRNGLRPARGDEGPARLTGGPAGAATGLHLLALGELLHARAVGVHREDVRGHISSPALEGDQLAVG